MNAVIYARLERWEHGDALLKERVAQCQTWAQKNKFHVVEVFQDQPCNGTTLDRPAFTALCEFVTKRRGYAIVVTDLLQLSCNRNDGEMLADVFDELFIQVYSVNEGRITPQHLVKLDSYNARKPKARAPSNGKQNAR